MKLYVDRIENKIAVCFDENENMVKIKIKKISGHFNEGCILKSCETGFVVDETETNKKRQEIFDLQTKIFEND